MSKSLFLLCILSLTSWNSERVVAISKHGCLLVVSFDGFRYDYTTKAATPSFDAFKEEGVSVPWMEARFPTMTHPNYQSINTGLYPESHGVTYNSVYDPELGKNLSGRDDPEFWNYRQDVMPLFIRNEAAGDERYSATYRWQGATTGYGPNSDLYATHRVPVYSTTDPWANRVETVIGWITNSTHPANLVYLYHNEPDTQGHEFSPDSAGEEGLYSMIRTTDYRLGYLIDELQKAGIHDDIDIMVVSDHGMETIYNETIIDTTTFTDPSLYIRVGGTPLYQLIVDASNYDQVYGDMKAAAETRPFTVFQKEEMGIFNYSSSRSIQDILLLADPGYAFEDNIQWLNEKGVSGVHGYDNKHPNMYAFFMAKGPSFKSGYESPTPINNVDLVPLMCKILGIPEPPNNGTLEHTLNLLKSEDETTETTTPNKAGFLSFNPAFLATVAFTLVSLNVKFTNFSG